MILSASRRTDIPAFYTEWFMDRVRDGHVMVRNPLNHHQISKVSLRPDVIDCIVFWTKDASPMLPYLEEIDRLYPFYFQYTLNAYDRSVEQHLPPLDERIETFRALSEAIGSDRVIWRYDPVLLSDTIDIDWHAKQFRHLADGLDGYTHTCVFSFIDIYDKIRKHIQALNIRACTVSEMNDLAGTFAGIAASHGLTLRTCAEEIDLSAYGIRHGRCIDGALIERLTGRALSAAKDKNQRDVCGCLESIDIGQYNTCRHGCRYCYANFNPASAKAFSDRHDPLSPLLVGQPESGDRITERKRKSLKTKHTGQLSMFDDDGIRQRRMLSSR